MKEEEKRKQHEQDMKDEARIRQDLEDMRNQYINETKNENKNEPFNFDNLPEYQPKVTKVRDFWEINKIQFKPTNEDKKPKFENYHHKANSVKEDDYQSRIQGASNDYEFRKEPRGFDDGRMHSDYGQALDSDIVRLRMEVNLQQKNLSEQLNALKFTARQATQDRDQAKVDLDRLIQNLRDRSTRRLTHENPLDELKTMRNRNSLLSQRNSGPNTAGTRRNLNTYKDIFFNDFKNPNDYKFAHNDRDPFNINISKPAQPKMHYNYNRAGSQMGAPYAQKYETTLNTNSQVIGLEPQQNMSQNWSKSRPDPLNYGINEFTQESSNAMNQIDSMISPEDSKPINQSSDPLDDLRAESEFEQQPSILDQPIDAQNHDIHRESMQQLDSVLESIAET